MRSETPRETDGQLRDDAGDELLSVLNSVPRKEAPAGLWACVARSISPEARVERLLARRRRQRVVAALATAATVLVAVGVMPFAMPGTVPVVPVHPTIVVRPSDPTPAAPVEQAALEEELETLGEVHLTYQAGNVLSEELVLAEAEEGYAYW